MVRHKLVVHAAPNPVDTQWRAGVRKMKTLEYKLIFNTPAFLGNAQQDGQWRTPPIKAQLRQWWRLAYAGGRHQERGLVEAMRQDEGRLFGVAADGCDGASRKSLLRLRLDRWDLGAMGRWEPLQKVSHPETPFPVGADLYLGYGPVTLPRGTNTPQLKARAAIQFGESALLSLAYPDGDDAHLQRALGLMHRYGTLGGRSRNGWGAYELLPQGEENRNWATSLPKELTRDWRDCLNLDWPHALGRDDQGPLIWTTPPLPLPEWKSVMVSLAKLKIGLRTQFQFTAGQNALAPEARHWLSYPVTNHSVQAWGGNARLPNSLRFKVRREANDQLRGVIFHVPCLPPPTFRPNLHRTAIESVWQRVHAYLDAQPTATLSRTTV